MSEFLWSLVLIEVSLYSKKKKNVRCVNAGQKTTSATNNDDDRIECLKTATTKKKKKPRPHKHHHHNHHQQQTIVYIYSLLIYRCNHRMEKIINKPNLATFLFAKKKEIEKIHRNNPSMFVYSGRWLSMIVVIIIIIA